nr:MAG TPA: restriction endonuclease [Caudoviricetes sp.]
MAQEVEKKPVPRAKPKAPAQKVIDRAIDEALYEVGRTKFTCNMCGKLKDASDFYKSTDPLCTTGVTRICKMCAAKLAYSEDLKGNKKAPDEQSVQLALRYLDKPFFQKLYDESILEAANTMSGRPKNNTWTSYIKNISMPQYNTLTWKDGDCGNSSTLLPSIGSVDNSDEVKKMYKTNKRTVISALGYDPFESAADADKPLMYGKLVGFLDESTQDDELKLGACVEIVHSLNQSEKINTVINALQKTPESIIKNSATIKALEATKKDIMKTTLDLARDNGISIKHSNRNTKGAHTLTGKLKMLKQSDLRSKEMNLFDINTAEGMKQVAELSFEAIMKQINPDENDFAEMVRTQAEMIKELQNKCDVAEEEARIYRRENNDLKEFLQEKKLINESGEVIYE